MVAGDGTGWTDPRYAGVVEQITNHSAESDHRTHRRPRLAFGGVPAFIVEQGDGASLVHCCGCLQIS